MITTPLIEGEIQFSFLAGGSVLASKGGSLLASAEVLWAERRAAIARRDFLRLDCFANNPVLRKYYENRGFEDRGEVDAQFPFGTLCLQRYEKHVLQK